MTDSWALWTTDDAAARRRIRVGLMFAQMLGIGAQYVVRPSLPDRSAPYHLIRIGEDGWRTVGCLVIVAALGLLWQRTRGEAFYLLGLFVLCLSIAQVAHGYWPAWMILPGGICALEVRINYRLRQRGAS